jgi:hypothetical protein
MKASTGGGNDPTSTELISPVMVRRQGVTWLAARA